MPRPKVNAPLNVFVNGRLVGVLKRNLLPDSEPIRRRLGATGADAYSMLSVLGHDCAGGHSNFYRKTSIRDRRARSKASSSVTMKSRILRRRSTGYAGGGGCRGAGGCSWS